MITKTHDTAQSLCLVTFTFQASAKVHHVSVCGDFNSWTAGAHPLQPLGGGKFSATIPLPAGRRFAFKYLCDHGGWHNDEAADEYAPNDYGVVNSVVSTVAPATKTKTAAKAPAKKAAANKAVAKTPSKEPPAKKAPAKKKAAAKKSTGSSD